MKQITKQLKGLLQEPLSEFPDENVDTDDIVKTFKPYDTTDDLYLLDKTLYNLVRYLTSILCDNLSNTFITKYLRQERKYIKSLNMDPYLLNRCVNQLLRKTIKIHDILRSGAK